MQFVSIFFRYPNKKPQRLIHGFRIRECIRHVRLKTNYIAKTFTAGTRFPHAQRREIIILAKLIV